MARINFDNNADNATRRNQFMVAVMTSKRVRAQQPSFHVIQKADGAEIVRVWIGRIMVSVRFEQPGEMEVAVFDGDQMTRKHFHGDFQNADVRRTTSPSEAINVVIDVARVIGFERAR